METLPDNGPRTPWSPELKKSERYRSPPPWEKGKITSTVVEGLDRENVNNVSNELTDINFIKIRSMNFSSKITAKDGIGHIISYHNHKSFAKLV